MLAVEDKRLFCELCQLYFSDSCPSHGAPHFIRDSAVPEGAGSGAESRAVLSLPQCLVLVERSQEPGGEMGIKDKGFFFYVDASDESKANWMRYVACASSEEEQNLTVFQYHGRIYYRVSKPIPAGAELRVWIGREYATMLGLQLGDHIKFEFGEKEILMKIFQDIQVVSVSDGSTSAGQQTDSASSSMGKTQTAPVSPQGHVTQSVSTSIAQPQTPDSSLPPGPRAAAAPPLRFNFVKGSESLVSLSRAQSRYWTFFGFEANCFGQFLDKTKIICKLCGGRLAYSGNTTNLRQHLIYKHRREFNQLMESGMTGPPVHGPPAAASFGPLRAGQRAPPPLASASSPGAPKQQREGEGSASVSSSSVTNRISPAPTPAPTAPPTASPTASMATAPLVSAARATNVIADFLVRDLLPPQTVEGEGFKLLMSTLLPSYQLPSAHFLSQVVLGGAYAQGRAERVGLLKEAVGGLGAAEKSPPVSSVKLSPDEPTQDCDPDPSSDCISSWSPALSTGDTPSSSLSAALKRGVARSRVAVSGEVWRYGWRGDGVIYVTLSAHFVDEDFRQRSLTLSSRRLGEEGASEGKAEALVRAMAREWGVAMPSFILLGGEEGVLEKEERNEGSLHPNSTATEERGDSDPSVERYSLDCKNAVTENTPEEESQSGSAEEGRGLLTAWPPISCMFGVLQKCMQRILQLPEASRALRRCEALVSKLLPFILHGNAAAASPRVEELLADPTLRSQLRSWGRDGLSWSSLYGGVQTLSDSQHTLSQVLGEMAAETQASSNCSVEAGPPLSPQPLPKDSSDPTPEQLHKPNTSSAVSGLCAADLPEPCDWSLLRELCAVLKPLDVACSTLAREQFPCLSLVKPVLTSLLSRHFAPRHGDSPFRQVAKQAVRESLEGRYSDPEVNRVLNLACALDPRFRGLEFVEAGERAETLDWLKKEAVGLAQDERLGEGGMDREERCGKRPKRAGPEITSGGVKKARQAGEPEDRGPEDTVLLNDEGDGDVGERESELEERSPGPTPQEKGLSDMEFLLGGLCPPRPQTPHRSLAQQVEREVAIFRAEPGAELGEEPLQWWRERASQLPLLARAARVYLAAPATAGHAPRLLKQNIGEGGAMFRKRANIPPEALDQLLFLHHNHLSVGKPARAGTLGTLRPERSDGKRSISD
ncbi:hypothetical protein JZ751_015441 [Albula glossodonta]|uniref:Uncharacterized protein n=1 Tax=Albula glossodonta TaxID=121402 RepID=A0A8T2MYJ9_9TELE|nr:hypothetical protein JZ751_015441 [Albula glossodonta]